VVLNAKDKQLLNNYDAVIEGETLLPSSSNASLVSASVMPS